MRKKILYVSLCVFGLLAAGVARADTITYTIGDGNTALTGYPTPFADLTIKVGSTGNATIDLTGLTQGAYMYLFGGDGALGLNLSNTNVTLGTVTPTGGGLKTKFTQRSRTSSKGSNLSSFGTFNFILDGFGGYSDAVSSLSFQLTGGDFANAASVLTANNDGLLAADHVFVSGGNCSGACVTGFASNGGISIVPVTPVVSEPPSLVLLGTGLLGMAFLLFRRKAVKPASHPVLSAQSTRLRARNGSNLTPWIE